MTDADDAGLVELFLERGDISAQRLKLKAQEANKGHDWVIPLEVVGCAEIIAVCREIVGLREALVDARQDLARTRRELMGATPTANSAGYNAASAFAAKHGVRDG